jgi:hypothetical protein
MGLRLEILFFVLPKDMEIGKEREYVCVMKSTRTRQIDRQAENGQTRQTDGQTLKTYRYALDGSTK